MTELTPEEKQRIYEEEKVRHEAQQKLKEEEYQLKKEEENKLKKEEEDKNLKSGCLGLVIIVALIVFFVSCCGGNEKSSSDKPKEPGKLDAYVMSQLFVEDKLKSPSTANFPVYSEEMVTDGGSGAFLISAYVDSQNGFGAKVRTRYSCLLQYDKEKDDWILKDMVLK